MKFNDYNEMHIMKFNVIIFDTYTILISVKKISSQNLILKYPVAQVVPPLSVCLPTAHMN